MGRYHGQVCVLADHGHGQDVSPAQATPTTSTATAAAAAPAPAVVLLGQRFGWGLAVGVHHGQGIGDVREVVQAAAAAAAASAHLKKHTFIVDLIMLQM